MSTTVVQGSQLTMEKKMTQQTITVQINYDCKDCNDEGALACDTPDGKEVQRCDTCKVYDSDAEPQSYYDIDKNYNLTVKPGIGLVKYPNSKKWVLKKEG